MAMTMPNLEEFVRTAAVRAERGIAVAPSSLPTHASMFTGMYPPAHGAHAPFIDDPAPPHYAYPLTGEFPTLAELLSDSGYITVAVSGNAGPLSPYFGLDRGFDYYRAVPNSIELLRTSPWCVPIAILAKSLSRVGAFGAFSGCLAPRVPYRRAEEITDEALQLLEMIGEEPFFLFVNYIDAHDPYDPPEGYRDVFPVEGPDDHANLYDNELLYLDSQLQRLLVRLTKTPKWDEMLLVITSDHGEFFGEHGLVKHSNHLFDQVIRVPVFVKPGRGDIDKAEPGTIAEGLHQSVDVFATILEHAGVRVAHEIDGIPWAWERDEARTWLFNHAGRGAPNADRFRREMRSIERDGWKFIASTRDEFWLFDLESDPREERNLVASQLEKTEEMRVALGPRLLFEERKGGLAADDEVVRRLRALGYLQ